ncbi:hypothetical protein [Actinoplanes aureus]|uniref:hypothetical protein n=1 Tax=Actinoplanes aureus TaxID=2792083 RepID=UPI001E4346D9|nr:hypothetical protein [Actinoplanes aureus]
MTGLGDRSSRVTELAPITPTSGTREAIAKLIERHSDHQAQLEAVLDLIEGFETPYSLELLATVHWASVQSPPTADLTELTERVAQWSLRKARLFTDRHIQLAAQRLSEYQLLATAEYRPISVPRATRA